MIQISHQFRRILLFCLLILTVTMTFENKLIKNPPTVDFKRLSNNPVVLSSINGPITDSRELIDFKYYGDQITAKYFNNIKNHIEIFSSFGSRVTGYTGYEHATNYIQDFFRKQNLTQVQTLSYPLLIPYDHKTKITINGENYTAHAFIPNSAHTCKIPSSGLSGTLIYGGLGTYTDLDGKKIEDSIVVLEFNTKNNWINVASLGAKAVIFLPPKETDRFEAEEKSIDIPLFFPRIYINNTTIAKAIRKLSNESNQSITLYSDVEWIFSEAKNVMGILPGLDDDIIIISAHFDSSSVVPAIAPGADEACGIATLLELIRLMRDENITPQKTIMFLALSGHNQAAAGAREFVYQNYEILNIKGGIKLFLSLDLSASNNKIGINPYGSLYKFNLKFTSGNNLYTRLKNIVEDFLCDYASSIREATGYLFNVESYVNLRYFNDIISISPVGDHEPFIASNVLGLSLFTAESDHLRFNTPFDLMNNLQLDMLKSQVVYSFCALVQFVSTEKNLGNYLDLAHRDFSLKYSTYVGFGNIEGYCKEYNETTAQLTNVANAVIRVTSRDSITGIQGIYSYYSKANENGYYQVRGVSSSRPDNPIEFTVEAYSFDSEGKLVKADNLGSYGQSFKRMKQLISKEIIINPMVFNCGTIGFFGVSHPYNLSLSAEFLNYQVLDPETEIQHFSHGYLGMQSVSLVFVSPDTPSVLIGEFPDSVLVVYATNSSAEALQGKGFLVQEGEFKNLGLSAFITSKDILSLTQAYIDLYNSYNIYDVQVSNTFQRTLTLIESAIQLKKNYEYSIAIEIMTRAQIWSYNALNQARNVIMGAMSAALLFAFLFLPFSFILSQLLFNLNSWIKQISSTCSIYALIFILFYFIHPGFQVAPHLVITLIGIINVVSVLLIIYFFFQGSYNFLRSQRTRMLGPHFMDISFPSSILIAFKTGISRMRKHKYQTIITLLSIGLLTFALTLLTSASVLIRNNFLVLGLPIVIAILLMINSSVTVVYASKREISVFTSLGVTPTHIITLFLTEFLVSAIVGSVIGYLGGITFIRMVSTMGLIPKTLPINYSSGAVVTALAFSTVGMLLSIIYPLKISGQMSVPSLKRTWVLTTVPEEDGTIWNIQLPVVTATEQEAEGIIEFLREFFVIFESESVGGLFSVNNIDVKNFKGKEKYLTATVTLAPFDMGIKQTMKFLTFYDKKQDHWTFEIKLIRLEGVLMAWEASVRRFISNIRKQLLIWKSLSKEDKAAKIERFQQEFS